MKRIACLALVLHGVPAPVAALLDMTNKVQPGRAGHREMQKEIERMASRADKLAKSDEQAAEEVEGALEDIEAALATAVGNDTDTGLVNEIRSVRGDLCSKQGFHSHERADCEAFMRKSCIPDVSLDAHRTSDVRLLPEDVCRHYFLAEVDDPSTAPPTSPDDATATAPAKDRARAKDRVWFSKSIDDLPEQGYRGDLVHHEDASTETSDWQEEFGPEAGHRNYRQICRDYPNNEWCRLHMNYDGHLPAGWSESQAADPDNEVMNAKMKFKVPKIKVRMRNTGNARTSKGVLASTVALVAVMSALMV